MTAIPTLPEQSCFTYGLEAMAVLQTVLGICLTYGVIGILFAIFFVRRGAGAIDSSADKSSLGFLLLIFPASAALWPVLARKWVRSRTMGKSP